MRSVMIGLVAVLLMSTAWGQEGACTPPTCSLYILVTL
jgi:hypothetical protein